MRIERSKKGERKRKREREKEREKQEKEEIISHRFKAAKIKAARKEGGRESEPEGGVSERHIERVKHRGGEEGGRKKESSQRAHI